MKIGIVTPAPAGSTRGNRITAERWARILRTLGHHVLISEKYEDEQLDLLIALHARRSHSSILRLREEHPDTPIILALTGTDVYRDIHQNSRARRSLKLADRIVVLQPDALRELTPGDRKKAHVIYQSVEIGRGWKGPRRPPAGRNFDICVIGHLRPVKDPLRAAMAARGLPDSSLIHIIQLGGALSKQMEQRALHEMQINQRYRWVGELSRARALQVLAQSRLCIVSSRMEGGANVISEAIVAGVPVLASRIAGNIGILGQRYPGLFRVGDARELGQLMLRAETDRKFLRGLQMAVEKLAPLFDPEREQRAWARLIAGLATRPRQ